MAVDPAAASSYPAKPSSTIGEQRKNNYALQARDVKQFVTEGPPADQPAQPPYFEFTSHRNRQQRDLLGENPIPLMDVDEVHRLAESGAILLDSP